MSMKQLLVYGASMLAVALGGAAVAQERADNMSRCRRSRSIPLNWTPTGPQ